MRPGATKTDARPSPVFDIMFRMTNVTMLPSLLAFVALAASASCPDEPKRTVAEIQFPERVFTNAAGRLCADFGKDAFGWLEIDAPAAGLDYFLAMGEHLLGDGTLNRIPPPCVRCAGVR